MAWTTRPGRVFNRSPSRLPGLGRQAKVERVSGSSLGERPKGHAEPIPLVNRRALMDRARNVEFVALADRGAVG